MKMLHKRVIFKLTAASKSKKLKSPSWGQEYKGAGLLFSLIGMSHTRDHVSMAVPEGEVKDLSLYRPVWERKLPKDLKEYDLDLLWARSENRVRNLNFHPEKGVASSRTLIDLVRKGAHGKDWYENTRTELKKYFGNDADLFLDILAHTSPRATLVSNIHRALEAYRRYKRGLPFKGEDLGGTGMWSVRRSLEKYLAGEDAGGPKVKSFIKSFNLDNEAVTVDVWLMRSLGLEPGDSGLKTGDYHTLAEAVRQLTRNPVIRKEFGNDITPRQVMAMLWVGIKQSDPEARNDRHEPYEVLIEELFASTPGLEAEVREIQGIIAPDRAHHYAANKREGKRIPAHLRYTE
jgi:hypothetical protein